MINIDVEELARITGGQVVAKGQTVARGVGSDTRDDLHGRLFVALRGARFDAHDFLSQAVDRGAAILLVDRLPADLDRQATRVGVVLVSDTLVALQALASWWRHQSEAQVFAITGSNGKTTTKEFTGQIMLPRFRTFLTPGNLNNHWGVPLSILMASSDTQKMILEMGMSHSGEILALGRLGDPDVVLVTSVGRAHLGNFSSMEALASAKEELYLSAPRATAVFNLDNPFTAEMLVRDRRDRPNRPRVVFSEAETSVDVSLRVEQMTLEGLEIAGHIFGLHGRSVVPIFGRQNISNLMGAICLAGVGGVSPSEIWTSLSHCHTSWGRNQIVRLRSGAQLLFDGYNANPESMQASVKNLGELSTSGKKILVLGEMLELGAHTEELHRQLGKQAAASAADIVWFVGPSGAAFAAGLTAGGFAKKSYFSDSYDEAIASQIKTVLNEKDVAVIKGSRGMKMEQVVEAWDPLDFFQQESHRK